MIISQRLCKEHNLPPRVVERIVPERGIAFNHPRAQDASLACQAAIEDLSDAEARLFISTMKGLLRLHSIHRRALWAAVSKKAVRIAQTAVDPQTSLMAYYAVILEACRFVKHEGT